MSKSKEIEALESRIAWIDEHEKMFDLSYCMILEREACNERLAELKGENKDEVT